MNLHLNIMPIILLFVLVVGCKGRTVKELTVEVLSSPSEIIITSANGLYGNSRTPDIVVKGVESGAEVSLYLDSRCSDLVGKKIADKSQVLINPNPLLLEGKYEFWARQVFQGRTSSCSIASVSYILDTLVPDAPSSLKLISPTSVPGRDAYPILEVGENIELFSDVILYHDINCEIPVNRILMERDKFRVYEDEPLYSTLYISPLKGLVDGSYNFTAKQVDRAGNESECSGLTTEGYAYYELDLVDLDPPSEIGVINEEDVSGEFLKAGTSPNPYLRLKVIEDNNLVYLFFDEACTEPVPLVDPFREPGAEGILITQIDNLLDFTSLEERQRPYGKSFTFYAKQERRFNNTFSDCSTAFADYRLDLTVRSPSSLAVSLPVNLSPDGNGIYRSSVDQPTIRVNGVEKNAKVRLYEDASCSSLISREVFAREESVLIQTNPLAEGAPYTIYAQQVDEVGNASSCSAVSLTYEVDFPYASVTLESYNYFDQVRDSQLTENFELSGRCSDNGYPVVISGSLSGSPLCTDGRWSANFDMTGYTRQYILLTFTHQGADNDPTTREAKLFVVGNSGFDKFGGGTRHACYTENGGLKCWGQSSSGQLGLGVVSVIGKYPHQMEKIHDIDLGESFKTVEVSLGDGHTCATSDQGVIKCWGQNNLGQLGQGDSKNRGDNDQEMGDRLIAIPPPTDNQGNSLVVRKVRSGADFNCAMYEFETGDREIRCWGQNLYGQLGLGHTRNIGDDLDEMNDLAPVDLGERALTEIIDFELGAQHACAIINDRSDNLNQNKIKCWGNNNQGRLGLGDIDHRGNGSGEMGDNLPFVDLGIGASVVKLALGASHSCALLDSGRVKCWGSGLHKQNGNPSNLNANDQRSRGNGPGEMGDLNAPLDFGNFSSLLAVDIAAGANHTCVVLNNSTVKCWGLNSSAQLGQGDKISKGDSNTMGDNLPVTDLGEGSFVEKMALGTAHSCVLLTNGAVKCWGSNTFGQLGINSDVQKGSDPDHMGENLSAISIGEDKPEEVYITDISAGDGHNCVSYSDYTMRCWGNDGFGQLGLGNNSTIGEDDNEMGLSLPEVNLGFGYNVQAIASAFGRSCALLWNGSGEQTVKCWGSNSSQQLGSGDTVDYGSTPESSGVAIPENIFSRAGAEDENDLIKGISMGVDHNCLLWESGSIHCWGSNTNGALGRPGGSIGGNPTDQSTRVDLGTVDGTEPLKAVQICSGHRHNCARVEDGRVKCWGKNSQGQLGIDNTTHMGDNGGEMGDDLPFVTHGIDLDPAIRATKIGCADNNSCALLTNGDLICWGIGDSGIPAQGTDRDYGATLTDLGGGFDDAPMASLTPVNFDDDANGTPNEVKVLDFFVHRETACANLDNGKVKCWGRNSSGNTGGGFASDNLGNRADELGPNMPTAILASRPLYAIYPLLDNTCALYEGNTLHCWGDGSAGVNGQEDSSNIISGGLLGDNLPFIDLEFKTTY